jgi:hypothetical protein
MTASPAPPIPAAATTQDTSKALADAHATVRHDLATAVRMAATLDRIILADAAGAAARLLPVRGQLAVDINHLFIASRRRTAMPSVGPSQ